MCVLITKPSYENLPSYDILYACADANPHGFGFATPTKYFRAMDVEKFMTEIDKIDKAEPCIIHFRYATTGSRKTNNCHPFKEDGVIFAHNGVLNIKTMNDMTDSETAFKGLILPRIKKYGFDSASVNHICQKLTHESGSKFALMKDGEIKRFGEFTLLDGCYFSNTRFMRYLTHKKVMPYLNSAFI